MKNRTVFKTIGIIMAVALLATSNNFAIESYAADRMEGNVEMNARTEVRAESQPEVKADAQPEVDIVEIVDESIDEIAIVEETEESESERLYSDNIDVECNDSMESIIDVKEDVPEEDGACEEEYDYSSDYEERVDDFIEEIGEEINIDSGEEFINEYEETELIEKKPIEEESVRTSLKVVDFDRIDSEECKVTIYRNRKPSLESLISQMPSTLMGYVWNGVETRREEIPVSWFCVGSDYEEDDLYYYQFSPSLRGEDYYFSCDFDVTVEAPFIPVYVEDGGEIFGRSSENMDYVYSYLRDELGLNNAAIYGVMANINCESSFNTTVWGDHGTSYGLCQWHNGRNANLKAFCADNDLDYESVEGQVRFLAHELKTKYLNVYRRLHAVQDNPDGAYNAAFSFCVLFESPSDRINKGIDRGRLAQESFMSSYGGTATRVIKKASGNTASNSIKEDSGNGVVVFDKDSDAESSGNMKRVSRSCRDGYSWTSRKDE